MRVLTVCPEAGEAVADESVWKDALGQAGLEVPR
jgi:hypothetical protein